MKKVIFFIFLIVCIPLALPAIALEVKISGDRFTLHAEQVPLKDILQRLADRGIKIYIDPQLNPRITASFKDREIQRGLESILKSLNHVLIWKSIEGPFGSLTRLEEIHVFRPGKKELIQSLTARSREIGKNPKDGSLFVKNEILLRLTNGIKLSDFKRFLQEIGGIVVDSNEVVGVFRIILPDESDVLGLIKRIKDYPVVAKAEPNYVYPIPHPYKNSDTSGYPEDMPNDPLPEGAVPVAVIDTGLSQNAGLDRYVITSLDSLYPEEPISDSLGHGTQMAMVAAGIIKPVGVSKNLTSFNPIIPIRAFDDNGQISNYDLMKSINFAIYNGAKVMSLSWGSETSSNFLKDNLDYAASKGMIIVASAGNEPTGENVYPAAYGSVIGVGALNSEGKIWEKSNYGDFVTVYAPGIASFPIGYEGDPGTYAGTSISTAFIANLIASYVSKNPNATISEILASLGEQESMEQNVNTN